MTSASHNLLHCEIYLNFNFNLKELVLVEYLINNYWGGTFIDVSERNSDLLLGNSESLEVAVVWFARQRLKKQTRVS